MWVKICANTCAEDALKAAELGADAVGFVFAPSRRQVHSVAVRSITEQMPAGIERVGVFVGADAHAIATALVESGLTTAQLHGGVDLHLVRQLRSLMGPGLEIIHCVHWMIDDDDASEEAVRAQLRELQPGERVLIDAKVGSASGGLGVSFDWQRAAQVLCEFPRLRIIIAGGLRPETVAEAVRVMLPYGVDVASGVEASAGKKDFQKLRSFIQNAKLQNTDSLREAKRIETHWR
jgi:phosphoribosylanthranilate isomerase